MPIPNAKSRRSWSETAVRFYDTEAGLKRSPNRRSVFLKSYARVRHRLKQPEDGWVLDCGCGAGEMLEALEDLGTRAVGVDISFASLILAKKFNPGARLVRADLAALPFKENTLNGLVSISSLEFCPDKTVVLREFKRVLKQKSSLYIDVRNRNFILFQILKPLLGLTEKLGFVKPYPAEKFQDLSVSEWMVLFQDAGLKTQNICPSLWPWNFGEPITRIKNAVIAIIKLFAPRKYHYMSGFVLSRQE